MCALTVLTCAACDVQSTLLILDALYLPVVQRAVVWFNRDTDSVRGRCFLRLVPVRAVYMRVCVSVCVLCRFMSRARVWWLATCWLLVKR